MIYYFAMVRGISEFSYRLVQKGQAFDLVTSNQRLRFTHAAHNATLSCQKLKAVISEYVKHQAQDFGPVGNKWSVTLADVDTTIKLDIEVVKSRSRLSSILRHFRVLIGSFFGQAAKITHRITEEFLKLVISLPVSLQKQIEKSLHVTQEEHQILDYLGKRIDFSGYSEQAKIDLFIEMLGGAYLIIDDAGATYKQWKRNLANKRERVSSHESNAKQYAVRGPLFGEGIFSRKKALIDGVVKEVTWFQLERHSTHFFSILPHIICWILYKITGRNQGPFGTSHHTEKNDPLVIKLNL